MPDARAAMAAFMLPKHVPQAVRVTYPGHFGGGGGGPMALPRACPSSQAIWAARPWAPAKASQVGPLGNPALPASHPASHALWSVGSEYPPHAVTQGFTGGVGWLGFDCWYKSLFPGHAFLSFSSSPVGS